MIRPLALFSFASVLFAGPPAPVSVHTLLSNASKYDQKEVVVRGVVTKSEQRTSNKGNPYFRVILTEKDETLTVFGFGTLDPLPAKKDKIDARGIFWSEHLVGGNKYKNELMVDIEPKDDKEKPIKILED